MLKLTLEEVEEFKTRILKEIEFIDVGDIFFNVVGHRVDFDSLEAEDKVDKLRYLVKSVINKNKDKLKADLDDLTPMLLLMEFVANDA